METVGSGLGDGVHDATAELAIFRVEAVGDEAEFLDGIDVGNKAGAVVAAFAYIAAIDEEGVGGFAAAVDADVTGGKDAGDGAVLLDGAGGGRGDACLEAE